jgi:hypothetical protein
MSSSKNRAQKNRLCRAPDQWQVTRRWPLPHNIFFFCYSFGDFLWRRLDVFFQIFLIFFYVRYREWHILIIWSYFLQKKHWYSTNILALFKQENVYFSSKNSYKLTYNKNQPLCCTTHSRVFSFTVHYACKYSLCSF